METNNSAESLMKYCPELFSDYDPIIFQHFLCPIAIVEADVEEYLVDEYDSAEFLVLKLYYAGIHEPETIAAVTGIDVNLIQKLLDSEKFIYGHIDPQTGKVTSTGKETAQQNTDEDYLFNYALYHVKRELQVDALTGTLIRAEAERPRTTMSIYNDADDPGMPDVLPSEAVQRDVELNEEIKERLQGFIDDEITNEIKTKFQDYIDKGYFQDPNSIRSINKLQTEEIRYRDAYYVLARNFEYPFLALKYKKYEGGKKREIVAPIAISETDARRIGMTQSGEKYLVRNDRNFRYLKSLQNKFIN